MRLLFGLLLLGLNASGQNFLSKDSSVVKLMRDLPSHEPFDTSHSYAKMEKQYVYIISGKDLYDIFDYDIASKHMKFDFANYHILGQQLCKYCLQCPDEKPCHRNACDPEWVWQVRENKKAFIDIPSTTKPGHIGVKLPNGRFDFLGDTVLHSLKDSSQWYTHGHGDCFAKFTYEVVQDKYHPVVLLKEKNYWGGCRAGGSKAYTISFIKPKDTVQYFKNTILMDKYKNPSEE